MGKTEMITFIVVANILLLIFIGGVFFFVFQYRRKKQAHDKEKAVLEKQHNLDLLNTVLQSQQQTMQHIGQEIHDSVAQKLTLASIHAQRMQFENKVPDAKESLEGISKIINDSLMELKQLSKSLTDSKIQNAGLGELITMECSQVNATGACIAVYVGEENPPVSIAVKSSLLRIVQEFIQNSVKHAGCKNIWISLQQHNDKLEMELTDDGKGFEMEQARNNGAGLDNIRRRIQTIGGTYIFESNGVNGTKLFLSIPATNLQA